MRLSKGGLGNSEFPGASGLELLVAARHNFRHVLAGRVGGYLDLKPKSIRAEWGAHSALLRSRMLSVRMISLSELLRCCRIIFERSRWSQSIMHAVDAVESERSRRSRRACTPKLGPTARAACDTSRCTSSRCTRATPSKKVPPQRPRARLINVEIRRTSFSSLKYTMGARILGFPNLN